MLQICIPGHEILHLVGEGGMAQVWAGARLGAGGSLKPVAVKRIRPRFAADRRYREMFLAEGRTTMMFAHGNIVNVFDVGSDGDELYIIMEWVDGVTLDHFARVLVSRTGQALELSLVITVVTQLLCALDYAHEYKLNKKKMGIIHRDVSPFNVMVTSSGEIKLMDFGVARVVGGHTTRSLKGNLSFMPMEQAQGDPRVESDLYAVGGIIYGMLEGKGFRSHCETEEELIEAIREGTVPDFHRAELPEALRQLVEDLLAPDWRDRPHSAAEVIKRIEALGIEQYTSTIPVKELYRTFFGESRSGLTRFAHRDPKMWVDHMRRQGQAAVGHRVIVRESAVRERAGEARREGQTQVVGAKTRVRPRLHEDVGLHRAGDEMDSNEDPFDRAMTVAFRPREEPSGGDPDGGAPREPIPPTVRLSNEFSASPSEGVASVLLPPTTRLSPSESGLDDVAGMDAASAIATMRGLEGSPWLVWVTESLGGGRPERVIRALGILLLACLALGVAIPLTCLARASQAAEVEQ